MKRSTRTPTQAEAARMARLARLGCCACAQRGVYALAEVHHLNTGARAGQRRRGHRFTIPLCPWHHRGNPGALLTRAAAERALGPSLALNPRAFRESFGSDDELLAQTDAALGRL